MVTQAEGEGLTGEERRQGGCDLHIQAKGDEPVRSEAGRGQVLDLVGLA